MTQAIDLNFATIRPIPDVAASLADQPTDELLRRVVNLVDSCARTQPDDHVSFSLCRVQREWCARIVSGPASERIDVTLRGVGGTLREALLDLLERAIDEDVDDDRPTYVDAFEPEDVASC